MRKRESILADTLEDKIIGLYGIGMSYRDIAKHIKEMYNTDISIAVLTQITDRIIPKIKAWQNRTLDNLYPIVFLDAMHQKIQENGCVKTKALYSIMAVNKEGKKEILSLNINESEGANFWLQVLTDLQNRGVKDILIACTDNLKGFSEAIKSIFPRTEVQSCVVHQIRNSLKYISTKNRKAFIEDLKKIYKAQTKGAAEEGLLALSEKWKKIPYGRKILGR